MIKRPSRRRTIARLRIGRWVPMPTLISHDLDWSIDESSYQIDWDGERVRRRPPPLTDGTTP